MVLCIIRSLIDRMFVSLLMVHRASHTMLCSEFQIAEHESQSSMDALLTPWSAKRFFRRYVGQMFSSQVYGMIAATCRMLGVLIQVQEPQPRGCPLGRALLVVQGLDPY